VLSVIDLVLNQRLIAVSAGVCGAGCHWLVYRPANRGRGPSWSGSPRGGFAGRVRDQGPSAVLPARPLKESAVGAVTTGGDQRIGIRRIFQHVTANGVDVDRAIFHKFRGMRKIKDI